MQQPSAIIIDSPTPSLHDVDFTKGYIDSKKEYQQQLSHWQKRLLSVQQAYFHQGRRVIIVLEGWDASGKGGLIRRITERLDPRGFQVYPIAAPSKEEQGRHYLYRFQKVLPPPGRFAIFDRSYYGRVLVERIEGFASDNEWQRAYQEINEFERLLIDDGVRIIKAFIHISKEQQLQRFKERLTNPVKRWKLTEEDIRNRDKWPEYEQAINEMFARTSTTHAPWHLVNGNHKWYARVSAIQGLVTLLEQGVDTTPPQLDPAMYAWAKTQLGFE
ncbi:polyphosphate kinase 2 family protein [Thalassotalea mangrovi]|uniref:Polyphosphate kinase n=1 Tax=Thalassotalea mangrovi TaxID=2572245 RepID=A0A4U1B8X3_9GAMM|nr:polyphosphate kinase [Thalassotalea mangrovi]TKB47150.1 polyphosphate kinase [Thalassotalea mangrovi]